jgi:uncharacterized protein (DUF924 family)
MNNDDVSRVLEFWFSPAELDAPKIDSRMDRWFASNSELDSKIEREFGDLVARASNGELNDWAGGAESRLALIILLDQFRRNIYRGEAAAFDCDPLALKLCIDGAGSNLYQQLAPFEQVFFFMPLQHSESLEVQNRSVQIYQALAESVTDTLRETFETFAQFAELHRDIIESYGRFPHRNRLLGRPNTPEEDAFLDGGGPSFGQ